MALVLWRGNCRPSWFGSSSQVEVTDRAGCGVREGSLRCSADRAGLGALSSKPPWWTSREPGVGLYLSNRSPAAAVTTVICPTVNSPSLAKRNANLNLGSNLRPLQTQTRAGMKRKVQQARARTVRLLRQPKLAAAVFPVADWHEIDTSGQLYQQTRQRGTQQGQREIGDDDTGIAAPLQGHQARGGRATRRLVGSVNTQCQCYAALALHPEWPKSKLTKCIWQETLRVLTCLHRGCLFLVISLRYSRDCLIRHYQASGY